MIISRRDLSGAVSSRTSPRRRWRGVFLAL